MSYTEDIFINPQPPNFYEVNINHPEINPLYRKERKRLGLIWCEPMSFTQRICFEKRIIGLHLDRKI